jgi:hypothetical protein
VKPTAVFRRTGARALRGWGLATADLRPLPDYLIIGTKRGGTTSMAAYLSAHPKVSPLFPHRLTPKGVRYFDEHATRGERWYRSHFATALVRGSPFKPRKLSGEASPNYLFTPGAAERAAEVSPDAKVIVLLRDPVDRAWSHWRERVRRGVEPLSFEDALEAEPARVAERRSALGRSGNPGEVAYRGQGCYADLLTPWLERFGDGRLLILVSEDLYADPDATYARTLEFLGLQAHSLAEYEARNYVPPSEEMTATVREELEVSYEPHIRRLEVLVGRDFPWFHRR